MRRSTRRDDNSRSKVQNVRAGSSVVYAKPPFAGPQQVLEYVGRYTHRVAISNNRLLDIEEEHASFRYKDYRADSAGAQKTMTLSATEFIRRFLLHVLPLGFHRTRYYGFLGNRHRTDKLAQCRQLLGPTASETISGASTSSTSADPCEILDSNSFRTCPACAQGQMRVVEHLARPYPAIIDTS